MASLDDLLTATKNIVTALNQNAQNQRSLNGTLTALCLTSNALVATGPGRLVIMNVIVAGAAGTVHDASSVASAGSANVIAVIPATIGTFVVNTTFALGLVAKPGAGMTVTLNYSA